MPPTILMDVDGVLITGRPDGRHWSTDLEARFGFGRSAVRQHFFQPCWQDIVTGRDELLPRLSQALAEIGSEVSAETLRDYWFAQDSTLNTELIDWTSQMRAKGYRIMLATNQDHSRAAYLMDDLDLKSVCDGIYHSARLGVAKPDASFFQAILEQEECAPSALILIDDTLANVEGARANGLHAFHYTGQPPDEIAAFVKAASGSVSPSMISK